MGCIAQELGTPQSAVVKPGTGCCCTNIVTNVSNISINMKNINVAILRGKVVCGTQTGSPAVAGAIVVASIVISGSTSYYVGITNSTGDYSICVPAPTADTTYSVEAYKCCCSSSAPTDAKCDCTC